MAIFAVVAGQARRLKNRNFCADRRKSPRYWLARSAKRVALHLQLKSMNKLKKYQYKKDRLIT